MSNHLKPIRRSNFQSLVGKQFGRLIVMEDGGTKSGKTVWICVCECGKRIEALSHNLNAGHIKSCGCFKQDFIESVTKNYDKLTYKSWSSMLTRCTNPNFHQFKDYGGRGITVCERWRRGEDGKPAFECFLEDMGARPSKEHTIERERNNEGYYKGNCIWLLRELQPLNRRNNVNITWNGETHCVAEWSRKLGWDQGVLQSRIRLGWTTERAMTQPVRKSKWNVIS